MAEQKELKKPGADQAGSIVAPCQKDIRLYPARLTLTDKAFEKIRTEGTAPVLPKDIPTGSDDYDLRRLRDGYIYILAVNAESDCFSITGEAENGQAWYIYDYRNNEINQGFSQKYKAYFYDLINETKKVFTPEDVSQNDFDEDKNDRIDSFRIADFLRIERFNKTV